MTRSITSGTGYWFVSAISTACHPFSFPARSTVMAPRGLSRCASHHHLTPCRTTPAAPDMPASVIQACQPSIPSSIGCLEQPDGSRSRAGGLTARAGSRLSPSDPSARLTHRRLSEPASSPPRPRRPTRARTLSDCADRSRRDAADPRGGGPSSRDMDVAAGPLAMRMRGAAIGRIVRRPAARLGDAAGKGRAG